MKSAWPGHHDPLGAVWDGAGTNFAVFAEHAERVDLVLFDAQEQVIDEYELVEKTEKVWHGYVPCGPGTLYGYRMHGPYDPSRGLRFNAKKVLLDPYAKGVIGSVHWGPEVFGYDWKGEEDRTPSPLDSAGKVPLGVVVDQGFPWHDDPNPKTPWADTVIYETHVRGFTMRHPEIPDDLRGTYLGLAHPAAIAHLHSLGATAIELMPVHSFIDPAHLVANGLRNYWGYDTINYFAPEQRYAASKIPGDAVREFKVMVRELHRHGFEVILDVVYNHTGEGNHLGPTLSFRGIDNASYYYLSPEDPRHYWDVTGCGNTLNVSQPWTLQLITDSLRYWVTEMHVDGFRFDLASALARQFYEVNRLSAFFDIIHQDPVLSQVKLIAEPWDIGEGGYQVGNFPVRWAEWNGKFRDTVRDYWRGHTVGVGDLAYRLTGSSDLYGDDGRRPNASINFVTAHDGFTLLDLVSYNGKHNEANKEDNRDGTDDNRSWNCGAEGVTSSAEVLTLRARQQRNLLATIFVSQGVPMVLYGDEASRTQRGNNNVYGQDNDLAWLDWSSLDEAMFAFTRRLLEMRRNYVVLRRQKFFVGQVGVGARRKDVAWFRPDGEEMTAQEWTQQSLQSLGMLLNGDMIAHRGPRGEQIRGDTLMVLLHAHAEDLPWQLPSGWGRQWTVILDTAQPAEKEGLRSFKQGEAVPVVARSLLILRRSRGN